MLGRPETVSLAEITPVAAPQTKDRQKDEDEALKNPSRKAEDKDAARSKPSGTLDVLKTENSFEKLTQQLVGENASLAISFDEEVHNFVYKSVDNETGEVLNQWPPEDYIKTLASLLELNPAEPEEGQAVDETV